MEKHLERSHYMTDELIKSLYYERFNSWERLGTESAERKALSEKIRKEKEYFISKMSVDDCQRFQTLENLITQAASAN